MAGEVSSSRGVERLTDYPLAVAVRVAGACLSAAGPRAAYRFAGWLAGAWYRLGPRRRAVALRNLEIAYGGVLEPAERERIALASYRHAAATAVGVFVRRRAIPSGSWPSFFEADAEVEEMLARPHPRGLVILSAHLGDWEMVHYYLALRGLPVAAVARRVHNPHLDRIFTALRTVERASVIPKDGALRAIRRVLRAGGAAGLMADQSAPPGERPQRFLGAWAATYFQYARLLARLQPDVFFVACVRKGLEFRFRLLARDLGGALASPGGEEHRAERLVHAYLSAIEEAVRAHPEQHLWMHRRWKSRPAGFPDLYQSLGAPLDPGLLAADLPGSPAQPAPLEGVLHPSS